MSLGRGVIFAENYYSKPNRLIDMAYVAPNAKQLSYVCKHQRLFG